MIMPDTNNVPRNISQIVESPLFFNNVKNVKQHAYIAIQVHYKQIDDIYQ